MNSCFCLYAGLCIIIQNIKTIVNICHKGKFCDKILGDMFSLVSAILSRGQSLSCGYLAIAFFLDLKDFSEINFLQALDTCIHSLAVVEGLSSSISSSFSDISIYPLSHSSENLNNLTIVQSRIALSMQKNSKKIRNTQTRNLLL